MTPLQTIDFASARARADLPAILAAEGLTVRSGMTYCPFHENHGTPAMSIYHREGVWRFKCHSCGAAGDAIDWTARREGINTIEAMRRLAPDLIPDAAGRKAARPASRPSPSPSPIAPPLAPASPLRLVAPPSTWEDREWQASADAIIREAEANLWGPVGRDALGWLHRRGLEDLTLRRFRIGFIPDFVESKPLEVLSDRTGPRPIRAPRGIAIPWLRPGSWYAAYPDPSGADPSPRWVGCNVRRLMPDVDEPTPKNRKCLAFAGSIRGFPYPEEILPSQASRPALILEGEFDAMLAWQEAGDLVNPVTVGGSEQTPQGEALASLGLCRHWLIATDHDAAGGRAARRFSDLSPHKARRMILPHGKDLTDFARAGGDVAGWIAAELARLGLRA